MSYNVYILTMKSGKKATMLTGQCDTIEEAEESAKERFGNRLLKVEKRSTTVAGIGQEQYNEKV
ncbi:hypothetical protein NIAMH_32 [Serratia phage vB_SmaS_Niamh]|uniref:Uncharacterized protein n=1 Tax=Serratia phage vB_SmaS_Ulliraptor TaxID=2902694 RepID=A0AC61TPE3_9CAUD|nr:hypothetical protein QJS27_gp31 [Serratia phage vB_SmaS_Ulliraptor]QPX74393.1 hypothetical protein SERRATIANATOR_37 [Serratia phage vB_SmaS_Serratianator]UGO52023.1 hypothetical protein ULLIRAPTOR_31 [Serratia phage vB_SmaS_Ulliraptor]UGO52986.1 hypothetical protein NIAMH_32 [Serratia phage vB_SmaS_Niamh]